MALPASGPISMSQINAELGLGYSLGAYRGTTWSVAGGGSRTISQSPAFSEFYSLQAGTSFTLTAGTDGVNTGYYGPIGTPFGSVSPNPVIHNGIQIHALYDDVFNLGNKLALRVQGTFSAASEVFSQLTIGGSVYVPSNFTFWQQGAGTTYFYVPAGPFGFSNTVPYSCIMA